MTFAPRHDPTCSAIFGRPCDCSIALKIPVPPVVESPCDHVWKITQFENVTLIPKKRVCSKCGEKQTSTLVWTTDKEE